MLRRVPPVLVADRRLGEAAADAAGDGDEEVEKQRWRPRRDSGAHKDAIRGFIVVCKVQSLYR